MATPRKVSSQDTLSASGLAHSAGQPIALNRECRLQIEHLVARLRRRQLVGSFDVSLATTRLLRTVISSFPCKAEYKAHDAAPTVNDLLELIKDVGSRVEGAQPIELSVGNIVRRVLHVVREEAYIRYRDSGALLHDRFLSESDTESVRASATIAGLSQTQSPTTTSTGGNTFPQGHRLSGTIQGLASLNTSVRAGSFDTQQQSPTTSSATNAAQVPTIANSSSSSSKVSAAAAAAAASMSDTTAQENINNGSSGPSPGISRSHSITQTLTNTSGGRRSSDMNLHQLALNSASSSGTTNNRLAQQQQQQPLSPQFASSTASSNGGDDTKEEMSLAGSMSAYSRYNAESSRAPAYYGLPVNRNLIADIKQAIEEMTDEFETSLLNISNQAWEHIHSKEIILTIGNSRTVVQFLKVAAQVREFHVIIAESAPSYEGQKMAKHLAEAGIDSTLITDSAIFAMMSRVNKVILGAHAVTANGGMVSISGTSLITAAAKHYSVPVVVCSGLYKMSPKYPHDTGIFNVCVRPDPISPFLDTNEDGNFSDMYDNVEIINPYFDYSSPDDVSLYITNVGTHPPSFIQRLIYDTYGSEEIF